MPTQISGTTGVSQVQDNTIDSNKIVDGTITNADISNTAGIDGSKLTNITNLQIASDAAIAGTKIAPDFGGQVVTTSGTISARSNGAANMLVERASTDGSGPNYQLRKSRGTLTSPTIVSSGDSVGTILFGAYDGTNFVGPALIRAQVDGTPDANVMPGRLIFSTTAAGGSEPTERMRITASGLIIAGGASSNTVITGSFVTSGRIQSDGTYSITTGNAANVHILTTGLLARSTSSRRYKTDIETVEQSYSEAAVLTSRPVWFRSTCDEDRHDWSHWGFIAEEIAEIDPRLVQWGPDENGTLQPEGVQYDRFVPHLCAMIQKQQTQIIEILSKVEVLETRISELESK